MKTEITDEQLKLEGIALENAHRAYQWAEVEGHPNPDALADKAYTKTLRKKACASKSAAVKTLPL